MFKQKKVLMIVENLPVPADPRVWREAKALREYGYQVSIICPQGEKHDQEAYVCLHGIHIYRYNPSVTVQKAIDYAKEYSIALIKIFLLSLKVWFRHGFDIIHVANPPDIFFKIGLFYRLMGKKYVFDQHDLAPEVFAVKFPGRMKFLYHLLRMMEYCSYRSANLVVTTNESQKQIALTRGKCPAEKVFVVRNGPDLLPLPEGNPEVELKMGKKYLLAYLGVMSKQDGVENTLCAMQQLIYQRGRHDVALVLMGDGDCLPSLQELAHKLKIDDYVHFTGWLSKKDLIRYLHAADIGLSPDPSNALNDRSTMLKTMEYMAMGKPVVAFDLPETRYSAQDAALYAQPNSIEDFADKIEIFLNSDELRIEKGSIGRERIEKYLSWNHVKENLFRAYELL